MSITMRSLVFVMVNVGLAAAEESSAVPQNATHSSAAGGPPGGVKSGDQGTHAGPSSDDIKSRNFYIYLEILLGSIAAALAVYHLVLYVVRYVRMVTSLHNDTQRYFVAPNRTFARFKQHLLYAPLFRNRHNREFRLSTATNFGTLPTRFQTLFLTTYLGINAAFCVVSIDWDQNETKVLSTFRNRTGILAVANMIPLFILAGRNNPLIPLLGISFDTFNLIHRWFGRVVVLEAVCHTAAFTISKVKTAGWAGVKASIADSQMILGGLLGSIAFIFLVLHSPSVLRHAFYETFLHIHIILAALSLVGLWLHLRDLPQMSLLLGVIILWSIERGIRMGVVIYRNVGKGGTKAVVETLPGEAVRVTLDIARPWKFGPGQHLYLYMPSIGLWTSHPFTIAWSEETENLTSEKGIIQHQQDVLQMQKPSMSLVIRRRTGFTEKLYSKAERAQDGKLTAWAFVEGPYGGRNSLHSYGTVMMFAGGIGISHQVPHVRDLVAGFSNRTVAARQVILVWIIRSPEHLEWIRPWMTTILAMERRREVLRILLFVTRPRSTREIHSPSATVQMFPGRPNIKTLIDMESENQIGAMAVTVCGTGSLSDNVRRAVRQRQMTSNVDLVEESFTW